MVLIKQIFIFMEKKVNKLIKKDKLLLIFLFGVLLLVIALPTKKTDSKKQIINEPESSTDTSYEQMLEKRLEDILSKVDGVGAVKTMVTLKSSKELVVKSDTSISENIIEEEDNAGGKRVTSNKEYSENVIYNDKEPYVIREIEPVIEGVVVIAKGGDNSIVAGKISEAIQSLFNIPAHKIRVMKMQ